MRKAVGRRFAAGPKGPTRPLLGRSLRSLGNSCARGLPAYPAAALSFVSARKAQKTVSPDRALPDEEGHLHDDSLRRHHRKRRSHRGLGTIEYLDPEALTLEASVRDDVQLAEEFLASPLAHDGAALGVSHCGQGHDGAVPHASGHHLVHDSLDCPRVGVLRRPRSRRTPAPSPVPLACTEGAPLASAPSTVTSCPMKR